MLMKHEVVFALTPVGITFNLSRAHYKRCSNSQGIIQVGLLGTKPSCVRSLPILFVILLWFSVVLKGQQMAQVVPHRHRT